MDAATVTGAAEAQIRARIEDCRAQDIDGIMSHFAPDVLAFDCHTHLQFKGAEAYRKHLEACLSYMRGPIIFEIHDLDITARDDVAFCHYLARCGGAGPDGAERFRMAARDQLFPQDERQVDDRACTCSAPFDLESGKALLDLKPRRRRNGPQQRDPHDRAASCAIG